MIGVLEVDNKDEVLDFVTCRSGPLRGMLQAHAKVAVALERYWRQSDASECGWWLIIDLPEMMYTVYTFVTIARYFCQIYFWHAPE
jgi:hypothetical protein